METKKIYNENCFDTLKRMPDNYLSSIVTDPPYGLSFMGKKWDYDVPSVDIWRECLRVLKPGGHLLAFAGTRTQHRMAVNIEDAGFEIRDMIAWVYGCLSEDTEILTKNGWERFHISKTNSIFANKEILIYDSKTDTYKWEVPQRWQHYNVKDTAYRIQSDNTDQIVSRNHSCLVERSGKLVFRKAEALQQQENIPFLESVPNVQPAFSGAHERASDTKQVLLKEMRGDGYKCQKTRDKKAKEEKVPDVRNNVLSNVAKQEQAEDILQSGMFGKGKRLAKAIRRQWQGKKKTGNGTKNGEKPRMERRRDLFQAQGEVCRPVNKIRKVSERVCVDGTEGRVRNGASSFGGEGDRQTIIENGVCASYKSRCNGQSNREFNAIQEQFRPQEVRTRSSYRTTLATVTPFKYSGVIFCPTVSTGAFVARRNGKIFITGNSGFPKSLDVSKAIDKAAGAEREVVGVSKNTRDRSGHVVNAMNPIPNNPINITAPATEAAKEWEGYGTSLKPALEPITVARKPLSGTVAVNVLEHGTGGLNIDACRVGTEIFKTQAKKPDDSFFGRYPSGCEESSREGRFPANLIHDGSDEVTGLFPDTGATGRPIMETGKKYDKNTPGKTCYGKYNPHGFENSIYYDSGSAARFFYCAKASKDDRGKHNSHPTVKPVKLMRYLIKLVTPPKGIVYDPFMGSGTTAIAAHEESVEWIGSELDPEYHKMATERVKAKCKQLKLF